MDIFILWSFLPYRPNDALNMSQPFLYLYHLDIYSLNLLQVLGRQRPHGSVMERKMGKDMRQLYHLECSHLGAGWVACN